MKTITTWKKKHQFESWQNENQIVLDGAVQHGFSPKALLLSALAACSGIDVVDILEKMRIEFSHFSIETSTEQTTDQPKVFKDIHLLYKLHSKIENEARIKKAIDLSLEKYCGVAAMLQKNSPIHYQLEIT